MEAGTDPKTQRHLGISQTSVPNESLSHLLDRVCVLCQVRAGDGLGVLERDVRDAVGRFLAEEDVNYGKLVRNGGRSRGTVAITGRSRDSSGLFPGEIRASPDSPARDDR